MAVSFAREVAAGFMVGGGPRGCAPSHHGLSRARRTLVAMTGRSCAGVGGSNALPRTRSLRPAQRAPVLVIGSRRSPRAGAGPPRRPTNENEQRGSKHAAINQPAYTYKYTTHPYHYTQAAVMEEQETMDRLRKAGRLGGAVVSEIAAGLALAPHLGRAVRVHRCARARRGRAPQLAPEMPPPAAGRRARGITAPAGQPAARRRPPNPHPLPLPQVAARRRHRRGRHGRRHAVWRRAAPVHPLWPRPQAAAGCVRPF